MATTDEAVEAKSRTVGEACSETIGQRIAREHGSEFELDRRDLANAIDAAVAELRQEVDALRGENERLKEESLSSTCNDVVEEELSSMNTNPLAVEDQEDQELLK